MKKILLTLSILLITSICGSSFANNNIFMSKGMFVPIQPTKVLSTSTYEEGDTVDFIVPSDMWIDEYKIIPKNSIIKAKITSLKMPVTGVNAAMTIKTDSVIFPDGRIFDIKGDVTYKGETKIGGTLTPPSSYNKSLHSWKGEYYNGVIAQYVPSGKYEFGQHITIMPSEMLYLILNEDFTSY